MSAPDLVPPDPPLATERVLLRPFKVDDAEAVARSCREPDIPRFTFMAENMTAEQAQEWIEQGLENWPAGVARFAITQPPDDTPLGQVGIHFEWAFNRAEAFYWLDINARGRGLAADSLRLVTEWAFEQFAMVRVQLLTHPENGPSQRVAERSGFTREGVLRAWEPIRGAQPDVVVWSRLTSDPATRLD